MSPYFLYWLLEELSDHLGQQFCSPCVKLKQIVSAYRYLGFTVKASEPERKNQVQMSFKCLKMFIDR